ncbi:alpha/beta fold hydrolase [Corticibacter populi]|uniref:Alpha/beta fold hydrolase n=1 Tax=Corticibacter populi TaxID=1550736 RepID=A0A3M6QKM7_9BURK|nr:alpha/beta fold hydrolase [Corticibacter populi]RMX03012.1 alpha/beta fold hydrolase [Corticibacter populi]RZS33444.1 pimeloyl-ACP methyl ester carboxylesterase [Corticibacter populi]
MPQSTPSLPTVLVPGLACSPRLFAPQLPALWRIGAVTVAATTGHDRIAALAAAILREAPPRFALAGLSMGGYIAFEMLRQAPERVAGLAILNSSARPDSAEASQKRLRMIELARQGKLALVTELNFPRSVHPRRAADSGLRSLARDMAEDTGVDAYVRQQHAIMQRADARPTLAAIACPSLIVVGDQDQLTPPELAAEMAAGIPGAELRTIADCGHLSTLEQPEAVTAVLLDWLQRRVLPAQAG